MLKGPLTGIETPCLFFSFPFKFRAKTCPNVLTSTHVLQAFEKKSSFTNINLEKYNWYNGVFF